MLTPEALGCKFAWTVCDLATCRSCRRNKSAKVSLFRSFFFFYPTIFIAPLRSFPPRRPVYRRKNPRELATSAGVLILGRKLVSIVRSSFKKKKNGRLIIEEKKCAHLKITSLANLIARQNAKILISADANLGNNPDCYYFSLTGAFHWTLEVTFP